MMIRSLYVRNFISHRDSRLSFPEGIVVLTGPNGAGKTSILDAISFALYKEHSRGVSLENVIRRGEGSAQIILEFEAGGKIYRVERSVVKTGRGARSDVKLYENNILRAYTDYEANKLIERILGMDKSLFLNSVYIRQGEIEKLVTARPAERKQVLAKLMGIDDLEKAYSEMREVIKPFEEKARELYGRLEERDRIIRELSDKTAQLNVKEKKLLALKKQLEGIQRDLKETVRKKEEYDKRANRFRELTSRLLEINKHLESLRSQAMRYESELKDAFKAQDELKKIEPKVSLIPVLREYTHLKREESLILQNVKSLEKELDELKKHKLVVEKYSYVEKVYSESKNKRAELERLLQTKAEVYGRLQTLKEQERIVCSELKSIREEAVKALSEILESVRPDMSFSEASRLLREKIKTLEEKLSELTDLIEKRSHEIEGLLFQIKELEEYMSELSRSEKCPLCYTKLSSLQRKALLTELSQRRDLLASSVDKLKADKSKILEERGKLESNLDRLKDFEKTYLLRVEEGERIRREKLADVRNAMKSLEKKLEELKPLEKEYEKVSKELEELEGVYRDYMMSKKYLEGRNEGEVLKRYNEMKSRLSNLQEKLKAFEEKYGSMLQNAEELLKEYSDLEEKADKLREKIAKIVVLTQAINEAKARIGELKQAKERLEGELKKLNYSEEEHRNILDRVSELTDEEKKVLADFSFTEAEVRKLKNDIVELERRLSELKRLEKEYARITKYISFLKKIRSLYGKEGLQKTIRRRSRPLIEHYTRKLFQSFNYEFLDIHIDDDYNITLVSSQGSESVDMISGGERVGLALALRLAIARVLAGDKIGFIMLDEPTIHLDEERRRHLVTIIKRLFKERDRIVPQLIIVTHERELEDAADVVYRVEREGGVSKVFTETEPQVSVSFS